MPSLAGRNTISVGAATMTTISSGLDAGAVASSTAAATTLSAATCTFSSANAGDYQQQQKQTPQMPFNNRHYHHPPPPHPAAGSHTLAATTSTATVGTSAAAAAALVSTTSLATFNGNSNLNVANGNIVGAAGNSNANDVNNSFPLAAAGVAGLGGDVGGGGGGGGGSNKSETSSTADSINGVVSGATVIGHAVGVASLAAIKKTTSSPVPPMPLALQQLYASREDVASLGGASSIHSQMSANNNNNNTTGNGGGNSANGATSNHNNNSSNNNHSSILKGSKENLLHPQYNGLGNEGPGDGLGPLPPKWETAYTERGELYFIDHNTGTSHWLDPRLSKFQKKSLEDCGDDELPYGWEKIEDSLYGTYYIDHVNRRTQYENPVLEAKRRAAEQRQKTLEQPAPPPVHATKRICDSTNGMSGDSSTANSLIPTMSIDISQRGMQAPPGHHEKPALLPYKFTRNPAEMQGERITTTLLKSTRGLGITIVGGDDNAEEFLQIKSIVPNGPAWVDGQLQTGDILVYVNDICVLGFTHHEMVNVFQSILPGETVTLEVCRGYPLPFDPNDPNTEVVTTIAVDGLTANEPEKQRRILMDLNMDGNYNFLDVSDSGGVGAVGGAASTNGGFILMKKPEVLTFSIVKGAMGFGFTIADSSYGQKVKKILDRNCCTQLQEGDVLLEIDNLSVRQKSHLEVVQLLKECSKTAPTVVKIQRGAPASCSASPNPYCGVSSMGNVAKLRKNFVGGAACLFRSKTPTADLYSTQQKEILPIRPKTPLVDTRRARVQTPSNELNDTIDAPKAAGILSVSKGISGGVEEHSLAKSKSQVDAKSTNSLQELDALHSDIPFMDPYPKLVTSLSERLAEATLMSDNGTSMGMGNTFDAGLPYGVHHDHLPLSCTNYENQEYVSASSAGYNSIYGLSSMPPKMSPLNPVVTHHNHNAVATVNASVLPHSHAPMPGAPLSLLTPSSGVNGGNVSNYHYHHDGCYCYDCQDYRQAHKYGPPPLQHLPHFYEGHHQLPLSSTSATLTPLSHHHAQYSPASHSSAGGGAGGCTTLQAAAHLQNERMQKRVNELLSDRRRVGFSPLEQHHNHNFVAPPKQQQQSQQQLSPAVSNTSQQTWLGGNPVVSGGYNTLPPTILGGTLSSSTQRNGYETNIMANEAALAAKLEQQQQYELAEVTLERQALGFGFRIVGGTEEGSQVTVGHVVPGGAADLMNHRINTGDEILSIDGINVVNSSHHKVVSLMGEAALRGQVTMILRRRCRGPLNNIQQPIQPAIHAHLNQLQSHAGYMPRLALRYPYDVIVSRHENEGFGFVIISSSNQYYGSTIGKLIPGSPADRCGELKVGDRIIAVNRIDIAGMSHGDVVNLIKESGLHVRLTIGCPKEGGATTASSGMLNSAQASPGQLSQTTTVLQATPPLLQLQHLQHQQQHTLPHQSGETPNYFERPSVNAMTSTHNATLSQQQLPQQHQHPQSAQPSPQQQQQQQAAPQL